MYDIIVTLAGGHHVVGIPVGPFPAPPGTTTTTTTTTTADMAMMQEPEINPQLILQQGEMDFQDMYNLPQHLQEVR